MIDLLVPYKKDSDQREYNKKKFLEYYKDYFNVVLIDDYNSRADAFNSAASKTESKFIALTDIDAIVPYESINKAIFMLSSGSDLVYPFDKILNLHPDGKITDDWPRPFMYGLMVCFNRQKFLNFGGENINFKGYGWEDLERYYRALNAGYKVDRVSGVSYHLIHPRTGFKNPYFNYNMGLMNKEKQKWLKKK